MKLVVTYARERPAMIGGVETCMETRDYEDAAFGEVGAAGDLTVARRVESGVTAVFCDRYASGVWRSAIWEE